MKMDKPWEKDSSDPLFNEFYTLPETCEKIFRPLRPFFMGKRIHCPCDDENSAIVKWLKENTNSEVTFSHLPEHDMNGDYVREMMLKSDLVVTNPPFTMREWKPFFLWLVDHKKDYFIFGTKLRQTSICLPLLKNVYLLSDHRSDVWTYASGKEASTIFYTSLDVPTLDYIYKPPKKEIEYYSGIPVFDRTENIPKDYFGWMYVPCTVIRYIMPKDLEFDIHGGDVPNRYIRYKVRRKHGDEDGS